MGSFKLIASPLLIGALAVLFIGGGSTDASLCSLLQGTVVGVLKTYLDNLILQLNPPPCSAVLVEVFRLLPVNLGNLFGYSYPNCALSACGQPNGLGYFDIYCTVQCTLSCYNGGICNGTATNTTDNIKQCQCAGAVGGVQVLENAMTLCNLIGNCLCESCDGTNGTQPWRQGNCSYTAAGNGVQDNCSY